MFLTTENELRDVAEKKSNWDSTETMKDERQDRDERDEQTHGKLMSRCHWSVVESIPKGALSPNTFLGI